MLRLSGQSRLRRCGQERALRFIGTVRQQERASLAFESAGTLTELRVDIGDSVKPGQVLARLDPQPAQLRLQEAQAALRLARAQALERQRNYQRQQNLIAAGSVAQSVVESAQSSNEQASAELIRTQADLDLARRELDRTLCRARGGPSCTTAELVARRAGAAGYRVRRRATSGGGCSVGTCRFA